MEPKDEMGQFFKGLFDEDNTPLNEAEVSSKEEAWKALNINQQQKPAFPIWKIAASLLLLLLAGSICFLGNKISQQQSAFTELDNNYKAVKFSLEKMEAQITTLSNEVSLRNNNNKNTVATTQVKKENTIETPKTNYIEKIVYQKDTIFITQNNPAERIVQVVRDTVFVETPAELIDNLLEQKIPIVEELLEEEKAEIIATSKKKKPKKVEFIFGKKPIEVPAKKGPIIFINDVEIAKKEKNK